MAGNYKLEAPKFVDGDLTWDGEWWEDAAAQDTATVLVVAAGAETELTGPIDRHGPGALTGTVTDGVSGDPVEGATVTLHRYTGPTDSKWWVKHRSLTPMGAMISAMSPVGRSISRFSADRL